MSHDRHGEPPIYTQGHSYTPGGNIRRFSAKHVVILLTHTLNGQMWPIKHVETCRQLGIIRFKLCIKHVQLLVSALRCCITGPNGLILIRGGDFTYLERNKNGGI